MKQYKRRLSVLAAIYLVPLSFCVLGASLAVWADGTQQRSISSELRVLAVIYLWLGVVGVLWALRQPHSIIFDEQGVTSMSGLVTKKLLWSEVSAIWIVASQKLTGKNTILFNPFRKVQGIVDISFAAPAGQIVEDIRQLSKPVPVIECSGDARIDLQTTLRSMGRPAIGLAQMLYVVCATALTIGLLALLRVVGMLEFNRWAWSIILALPAVVATAGSLCWVACYAVLRGNLEARMRKEDALADGCGKEQS